MTDKVQLIKEEILRRKQSWQHSDKQYEHGGKDVCDYLLGFIDSLPEEPKYIYNRTLDERKKFCKYCSAACDVRIEEEPLNEDLEEEIDKCWGGWIDPNPEVKGVDGYLSKDEFSTYARHFAEWQKQQMIKDAAKTTIVNDWQYGKDPDHAIIPAIHQRIDGFNVGDKVKIIIVKENK